MSVRQRTHEPSDERKSIAPTAYDRGVVEMPGAVVTIFSA
jgi:hypothetical protein